jgi:hypothetical protein
MSKFLVCSFCGRTEHVDRIKIVQIDKITHQGKSKCFRCRIPPDVRPIWDRMTNLELLVKSNPDSYIHLEQLRLARLDYLYARRPKREGDAGKSPKKG